MAEPAPYIVGYDFTAVPGGTNLNIELAIVDADGDDYFEFWVQGDGAGDKTVSGSSINTWFCGAAL